MATRLAERERYALIVSNIAEDLRVPHATVVRHLKSLEAKGWVRRSQAGSTR